MIGTLAVFLMALWSRSLLIFFVAGAGAVTALRKLPDPVPPFKRIEKILESERKWLRSPWSWKKVLQTFGMFAAVVYVCWACWVASIMALLLFIGICVNIACVYVNKAMGVDEL